MKEVIILELAYGVLAFMIVLVLCMCISFKRKANREIDSLWNVFRKQVDFNDAVCKSEEEASKSLEDQINFLR